MIPPNSLIKGNCLDILPYIESNSVQLILTDLPYATTDLIWDSLIDFNQLWKQWERILVKNGTVILTSSQPFTTRCINSRPDIFKYELIWIKNHSTGFQHAKNRPLKITEDVLIFSFGSMMHESLNNKGMRMTYNPQGTTALKIPQKYNGTRKFGNIIGTRPSHKEVVISETKDYPENIVYFEMDSDSYHPTQKPEALFRYLIETYSNKGDLVVDNCGGSFTTAVASQNCERNYIIIELDPPDTNYFSRGVNRVIKNVPVFGGTQPIVIENLFEYLMK